MIIQYPPSGIKKASKAYQVPPPHLLTTKLSLLSIQRKILEKQIKKIHSQVLRRSEPSGSESNTSVDVVLNNLSLRASLRSDLVGADFAICQVDCPIVEETEELKQQHLPYCLESLEGRAECMINANLSETSLPACCLAAFHNQQLAWQLEATHLGSPPACCLAAAAANQYHRKESCCLSALNTTNGSNNISCASASMDELNNECKQTMSSRISSEHDKELASHVVSNGNQVFQERLT